MKIAYVGSGGKTTKIHQDAKMYLAQGKTCLVTTSTHMFIEEDSIVGDDPTPIIEALQTNGYAMAGSPSKEGKIQALPPQVYEEVCAKADVVLIEADGSKQLPLKLCNAYEPVIDEYVDEIVVVIGLSALGKKAKDVCHRLELVKDFLDISDDTIITSYHIERLLWEGYIEPLQKQYPHKKIIPYPSQIDTLYQKALTRLLCERKDPHLISPNWFSRQPHLFICGGGHIAHDLAKMAACLDFEITVMDDRAEFANKQRFPWVNHIICDSFSHLSHYLEPNAFYVVVTRGHQDDYSCVQTILNSAYTYLGMIGSHKKVKTTLERLSEDGFEANQIQRIHAPIGLNIGACTPSEIAVSILAEIIQEKNKISQSSVSQTLLDTKKTGVLCIIVDKKGSSPRGVGSMMMVCADEIIDSIGGGAIENEVITYAKNVSSVQLKTFDLDNATSASLGMICGGQNTILFIPLGL